MKIQHILGELHDGKLSLNWLIACDAKNISVQLAQNSEFTDTARHLILPPVSSCILTVGKNNWYVRIGAWIGDTNTGTIGWSGIVGPFTEKSIRIPNNELKVITPEPSPFQDIDGQSIQKGYRINTHTTRDHYVIIESSTEPQFLATQTNAQYAYDWGRGYIDCIGLSHEKTYYIRISVASEIPGIFIHDSIRKLSEGVVLSLKTASKPIEFVTNTELNLYRNGKILLDKVKNTKGYTFKSYAEYIQYKLLQDKRR